MFSNSLLPRISSQSKIKACFIWPYFGPQYYSRFAATKLYLENVADIYCIALSHVTSSYAFWQLKYDDVIYCVNEQWEKYEPSDLFSLVFSNLSLLEPDIVFVHSYSSVDSRAAAFYALRNGKRLCIMSDSHHSDYPRHWFVESIKSLLINGADALLVSTPSHSHYYSVMLGFKYPVFLGYNAVDPLFVRTASDMTMDATSVSDTLFEKPFLFCAARPISKKNIKNLCLAWSNSSASKCRRLLIAGGSMAEYGVSSLDESIVFLGPLTPSCVHYITRRSSGCILPSISEQFGNFILEAIVFNRPVLISEVVGALPLAALYGSTYIFDPFNIKSISSAIDKWCVFDASSPQLANYLDPLPVFGHVRDFASSVYSIIFSYRRRSLFRRMFSLAIYACLNLVYRNKLIVDINSD